MTLTQLTSLNNYSLDKELTIDDGIAFSKQLLGEHKPFSVRKDIGGEDIVLFNVHFVGCMRQALTDGCIARMGKKELKFWLDFVTYQNDIQDGIRDDIIVDANTPASVVLNEKALQELSRWISDELAGIPHPETKECYIPYTL